MSTKEELYSEHNSLMRFRDVLYYLRGNIRRVSGCMDIVRIHDELAISLNKAFESFDTRFNIPQKQILEDHVYKEGERDGTPISYLPGSIRVRTWGRLGSGECHEGE